MGLQMQLATTNLTSTTYPSPLDMLPASFVEQHWYAAYLCVKHEKRVAEQLAIREVEHFLPLYSSVRRWNDRRVTLELPLFPGYVFVRLALRDRLRVLRIPSVVHLVGWGGHPTPLPEEDVARVREFLGQGYHAEPHAFLQAGRRVRVKSGPLEGMEGIIVRRRNGTRFVISFELLQRSIAVEVEEGDLAPVL